MQSAARLDSIAVDSNELARVLDLYERGLCLQAYQAAISVGPLHRWSGADAMIVAGRLAMNLGAPRLACRLHLQAGRFYPEHQETRYYYARALSYRRGPLTALRYMEQFGDLEEAPPTIQAEWCAFRSILQAQYRDFAAAERSLARAERLEPELPWVILERAHLLEMEDRLADSLAASRRALEIRPWYRPAVQSTASTLVSLGRDQEAIALLEEAAQLLENAPVVTQLGALQTELRRFSDARATWERVLELSPLMEQSGLQWITGRRSDAAYACGDLDQARTLASESKEPFFLKLTEFMAAAPENPRRVLLDVEFVRQHHQTCAPATLSSIARFWKKPAEHLEVAEAICYDGTPDHRERSWATSNGWHAREFTVTWDSAVALLDAGIPFTLTTIEVVSAHLQAVIGYDERRRTLLIRDPSFRSVGEVFGEGLVERYRSTGPRGMALVPIEQADRLDAIELPDAPLYDTLHRMQRALDAHDRASASIAYAELETAAPDHRLTHQAARLLAIYDADSTRLLAAIDRLLVLFPDDPLLQLSRLSCLREFARRDDRIAMLRTICARPEADPVFRRQLARELSLDARENATTLRLLRRVLRMRGNDDQALAQTAGILWDRREYEEACRLYRLSACLEDKNEGNARSYFIAARYIGRVEEALSFLNERFQRYAARSGAPTRTLFWGLSECERTVEGFAKLEEAMRLRTNDGELRLFAAEEYANHGDFDRAAALLELAQGHVRPTSWFRSAAALASAQGELPRALEFWKQVIETEPAAIDAHQAIARLTAETASREAALEHLREVCDRFPHNYSLQQLSLQWLREEGPSAVEPVIRRMIETHPDDAWTRREWAIALSEQGRHDEALAQLDLAERLEPASLGFLKVKGQALARAGRHAESKQAFQEAIKLTVDDDFSINELMSSCETRNERLEILAFIASELERQVILGDGLLAYLRVAQQNLEPETLLTKIEQAWRARPDLWQTWSAYERQLNTCERHDEARAIAKQAVERFPLVPRLWLDLATIENKRKDREKEIEALTQALRISPGWGVAARQLAQAHEEDGHYDRSRVVLERAITHAPLDALNHGWLADALWKLDEKEAAIERVRKAVMLDPRYEWAWRALRDWTSECGRPEEAAQLARELTERRAGDAAVWLILARILEGDETLDERIAALSSAIALEPRNADAHDLLAELLARAGRFDEARAAAAPEVFGDRLPLMLKGRAAWVEAMAGRMPDAIEQMRSVLVEDPDYYWGWRQLSEWLDNAGEDKKEELRNACDQLVRLSPDNATAYGYRGDARRLCGDRAGAKADFATALKLLPSYLFAGLHLFELQFDDEEWEAAGQTLDAIDAGDQTPSIVCRGVRLACAQNQKEVAKRLFVTLCEMEGTSPGPYENAIQALAESGWTKVAESWMSTCLQDPEHVNPMVAGFWVEASIKRDDYSCLKRVATWKNHPPLFAKGLEAFLRESGKKRAMRQAKRAIRRFEEEIRADTKLWGMAGYALTTRSDWNKQACSFMSDWQSRRDVEPWMLGNLAIALRGLERWSEASSVSQHAITLASDFTIDHHRIWLALDALIDGRVDDASLHLAPVTVNSLEGMSLVNYKIASALRQFCSLTIAEQRHLFGRTLGQLKEEVALIPTSTEDRRAMSNTYRRAIQAIARRLGGQWFTLVSWWNQLQLPLCMQLPFGTH